MKTTGNDWVLVNLNITGYYRVNYDTENWERLLNQLTENHKVKTQRHVSEITDPVLINKFDHIYCISKGLPSHQQSSDSG